MERAHRSPTPMSNITNWVHPRAGLASAKSTLTNSAGIIGYLGASTLAQQNGYRPRLHTWLCQETGNEHRAVNAGLGANGSLCSVFVMDKLVLPHSPVLCFIDLSVADMAPFTPLSEVGPVMEGIVRKLLSQKTQICFLYMYRSDRQFREMDEVVRIHEAVAAHYGIPSINLGLKLEQQILDGNLTREAICTDMLHTHPQGAAIIANHLTEALSSVFSVDSPIAILPEQRLFLRSYEHTKVVEITNEMFLQGKSSGDGMFRLFYKYKTVTEHNPVSFRTMDGEVVGILAIVGKESGIISVLSNGLARDYLVWDPWCIADRVQAIIFDSFVEPNADLQIVPTNKEFDSSDCTWMKDAPQSKALRLVGFLVRQI